VTSGTRQAAVALELELEMLLLLLLLQSPLSYMRSRTCSKYTVESTYKSSAGDRRGSSADPVITIAPRLSSTSPDSTIKPDRRFSFQLHKLTMSSITQVSKTD